MELSVAGTKSCPIYLFRVKDTGPLDCVDQDLDRAIARTDAGIQRLLALFHPSFGE